MDVAGQVANVLPDWFVPRRLLQGIVGLSLSATLRRRHQWQLVVTSPAGGRSSEKAPDPSNLCRSYLVRTSRFRGPKAAPTSSSRMDRPRQIPYSRMADILTLGLRNFGGGWGWTRMKGTRTWFHSFACSLAPFLFFCFSFLFLALKYDRAGKGHGKGAVGGSGLGRGKKGRGSGKLWATHVAV